MAKAGAERDALGRTVPDLVHTLERVRAWLEQEDNTNPLYHAFEQAGEGEESGLGITGDGDDQMEWARFLHLAATTDDTIYWHPIHPALHTYRFVIDALLGDFGTARLANHEFHYFSEPNIDITNGMVDLSMCDRCDLTVDEYEAQRDRAWPPNRRPRTQAEYDMMFEQLDNAHLLYPYRTAGLFHRGEVYDIRPIVTAAQLDAYADQIIAAGGRIPV